MSICQLCEGEFSDVSELLLHLTTEHHLSQKVAEEVSKKKKIRITTGQKFCCKKAVLEGAEKEEEASIPGKFGSIPLTKDGKTFNYVDQDGRIIPFSNEEDKQEIQEEDPPLPSIELSTEVEGPPPEEKTIETENPEKFFEPELEPEVSSKTEESTEVEKPEDLQEEEEHLRPVSSLPSFSPEKLDKLDEKDPATKEYTPTIQEPVKEPNKHIEKVMDFHGLDREYLSLKGEIDAIQHRIKSRKDTEADNELLYKYLFRCEEGWGELIKLCKRHDCFKLEGI